jgi:hypothetical protein
MAGNCVARPGFTKRHRCSYGVFPKGKLVAQTEDVLVDTRGYICITDKDPGLYNLKYTGK